jgi:hypothetical protein
VSRFKYETIIITPMTNTHRLSFEGRAVVDGTPVSGGSVIVTEVDEITTDGPLAIDVENLDNDSTPLENFATLLQTVAMEADKDSEILDWMAVEFAEIDPDAWADVRPRKTSGDTVELNASKIERQLGENE